MELALTIYQRRCQQADNWGVYVLVVGRMPVLGFAKDKFLGRRY
ncbi:MAG: hypothetical protein NZ901_09725 [Geminocystis sp.]|nr:hypothetical protein [Geminocystis sp.]MCS7148452.1 hypothetical protein [Geminocystis sp.]MCX8078232.1 hypothetical protein [Geminocystis sp.]MDW8115961.1 hypothetical protein [Geminocystis sp.]MDW8463698.1 hypothetical protein [Geminocystis sp.]